MNSFGSQFMEMHRSGTFVMANVADAGTARALCGAGVAAIATTSSGHASTIGRRDAAGDVTMDEHAEHTAILVAASTVPCNVDAENGYGHEPEDMAAAVISFAATGAAGMGIEDWSGDPDRGLYDRALAIARIEAAVEAAEALDDPCPCQRLEALEDIDGNRRRAGEAGLQAGDIDVLDSRVVIQTIEECGDPWK